MYLSDVINDVSLRLSMGDVGDIDPSDEKKIINSLARVFDSFSIDGRKIPTTCSFNLTIPKSGNIFTVGKEADINLYNSPIRIESACWVSDSCNEVYTDDIRVLDDYPRDLNHHEIYQGHCRPYELFYNAGQLLFSGNAVKGDKMMVRAIMPFSVELGACDEDRIDAVNFKVSPEFGLSDEVKHTVIELAKKEYDCKNDWSFCAKVQDKRCCELKVTVTAEKQIICNNKIDLTSTTLPSGYYSALVSIVSYELAPFVGISRSDNALGEDRDRAVKLLHRSNEKTLPNIKIGTMPHVGGFDATASAHTRYTKRW